MPEPADDQRTPLLVFVHIPKTAGTTLTTILKMNEPGARSRALGNVFKGGGGVKQEVRFERLRDDEGGLDLEGVRVLTGHLPLGIREYLPEDRDVRCLTFLREPADRTLSHYFQIRNTAERDRALGRERSKRESFGLTPLPPDPTIDDAVERGYIHDNLQTRMLSGLPEPFDEVTDEMLEQAKHNLREELVFFGLSERFDESLVLAKRRLGLGSVLYKPPGSGASSGRVNPKRPRGNEVPKELVRAAERCNRYDIELYRYATELFGGAPELDDLEFQVELAALRAARADGEIDLEQPAPSGFGGGEEEWRMLLGARANLLRDERELAEIKMLVRRLGHGNREILENLHGFKSRGKRVAGRDADAAATDVIQLLGTIGAALRAEGGAAAAQPKEPGTPEPARAGGQRASARRASTAAARGGRRQGKAAARNTPTSSRQAKGQRRTVAAGSPAGADGAGSQKGRGTGGRRRAAGAKRGRSMQPSKPVARGDTGSSRQDKAPEASSPAKRTTQRRRSTKRASAGNAPDGRGARKGRRRVARDSQRG